ncbi:hypothetical protein DITRI_Ditri05aG0090300 [Diplodiscus trichospermus]
MYKIQRRFLWGGNVEKRRIHWVDWKIVCKPKEYGENKALWRRMTAHKYGGQIKELIPNVSNYRAFSSVWKDITKLLVQGSEFVEQLASGIGFVLGNGGRI